MDGGARRSIHQEVCPNRAKRKLKSAEKRQGEDERIFKIAWFTRAENCFSVEVDVRSLGSLRRMA